MFNFIPLTLNYFSGHVFFSANKPVVFKRFDVQFTTNGSQQRLWVVHNLFPSSSLRQLLQRKSDIQSQKKSSCISP